MKTFLILLLALLLLSGCQVNQSDGTPCTVVVSGYVWRCIDKDYGYVCYLHGAEGIWCGKLEQ